MWMNYEEKPQPALLTDDEQIKRVLDYCHTKDLMENGKLESNNGTDIFLDAIGYHYFNNTHYIDNNTCEWQLLENYPNSDILCIPGEQNFLTPEEIRNDTHIYNKDKCLWQLPFKTLTTAESRDLKCLRIYKDIREISRTPEMALAETHALQSLKNVMDKYMYYNCPDFPDFEFMYGGLKNIPSDLSPLHFRQSNCENLGGTWLSEPNECENISYMQCSQMSASYSEESTCRYYDGANDCLGWSVAVCSEDTTNNVEEVIENVSTFDYEIKTERGTFGSQYQITGASVDEIIYDSHSNSLIISFNESEKGYLQIVIQIGLLHSLDQSPFTYFVIVDGKEVVFEQLSPIILKIPFEKDTQKIEIIGTLW